MPIWGPIGRRLTTHVLRNEAIEATQVLRDILLVHRNDLAEVFRVHARR